MDYLVELGGMKEPNSVTHIVGVISDTHGLLRPEVFPLFKGVELIIHAGDVGKPEILRDLENIAPVVTVRGNIDQGPWAETLPESASLKLGGTLIFVIHDLNDLRDPGAEVKVVISGHTHQPLIKETDGVLYLNPGSAGPRRFKHPISVALLRINEGDVKADLIELNSP